MPASLVIGGSGQIGRYLVPKLLEAGYEVIALSRQPRTSRHPQLRWVYGDLNAAMPALPPIDTIFSLGPLDAFSHWLAAAPDARVRRVVAFGSMSAVSKLDSPDPKERELAASLRSSEQRLIDGAQRRGIGWTLFRPTLIYGAGIDRSLTPIARLGRRLRVFPVMRAAPGLRQPVHAEDLADVCISAAKRGISADARYALGGGETLAFAAMLQRVRDSLGVRTIGVPIGAFAAHAALSLARLHPRWRGVHPAALARLQQDLLADDAAARSDLDWSPRGFQPTVSTWFPVWPV